MTGRASPRPTLAARVLERKNDLEDALADIAPQQTLARRVIETALATLYPWITGDLAHPAEAVARRLNRWLERNKHVAIERSRRLQPARSP